MKTLHKFPILNKKQYVSLHDFAGIIFTEFI